MKRQTKNSSYRDLSSYLKNSEDIFQMQILSRILDEYDNYHVHDFLSFEQLIINEKDLKCPRCNSIDIVKNGKDKNNTQRYKCKACGKNFNIAENTPFFSSKINIKAWYAFLECILSGTSVAAACMTAKISTVTGTAWMKKIFNALSNYQDTIILDKTIYIDETYVHEDASKIIYMDEIGKSKKVKKQPRGISRNKICILVATDNKRSFAEMVNHGRPKRIKNYEISKKHIQDESLIIGDEDNSLTYTAKELNLSREMYKSNTEEAYEKLAPIDQLCSRLKFFLDKHRGFKKDILQDYINLFIFIDNEKSEENDLFEITIKLMKMIINSKKPHK
jgi:transposase-like protein